MQFINTIRDVKSNYSTYDEWEQKQADLRVKKAYLAKNIQIPQDKAELLEAKAKTVIRATEMLDKRSENNAEQTEMTTGLLLTGILGAFSLALSSLNTRNFKKNLTNVEQSIDFGKMFGSKKQLIGMVVPLVLGSAGIIWANAKQKEASRIGRFQAKNNELKDINNFILYTPEQIEAAKILVKNLPDEKDNKSLIKAFREMKQLSKDKKAYTEWLKDRISNDNEVKQLSNITFTDAQIKQGNEDKELIVSIVKDVNIKAEEYSENLENMYDTLSMSSFIATLPLTFGLTKLLSKTKKLPNGVPKAAISILASSLVTLGIASTGTREQKTAAMVGRFKARKELLENPALLSYFSNEELEKAKDIKAEETKITFGKKLKNSLGFLTSYNKDKKEYNKYIKTEQKENEKIRKALSSSAISESQVNNAKNLQEKVFNTFDEIDEMSQRYSEDVEAGTEIAKNLVSSAIGTVSTLLLALPPILLIKGRLPIHKITKMLSNISLDKSSSIKQLIDEAYSIISSNKELKKAFNNAILEEDSRKMVMNDANLAPIMKKLKEEALHIIENLKPGENIEKVLQKHFKQGFISKGIRNVLGDILKIKTKMDFDTTKTLLGNGFVSRSIEEKLKFNYNNYKSLFNALIIGFAPIMGITMGLPFAFSSWLTGIQKKAGKIGIMKAMETLDDPRLFVDKNTSTPNKSIEEKKNSDKTTSLIELYSSN